MGLALAELELLNLRGHDHTHDIAVLLDSLDVTVHVSLGLGIFLIPLGILGESALLRAVEVLIESSQNSLGKVLGPNGGETTKTSWSVDVSDHSHDFDWWGLDHSHLVDDFDLDGLLTFLLLRSSDNMGASSFVPNESSKMDWLGPVILRESLHGSLSALGPSLWKETEMA